MPDRKNCYFGAGMGTFLLFAKDRNQKNLSNLWSRKNRRFDQFRKIFKFFVDISKKSDILNNKSKNKPNKPTIKSSRNVELFSESCRLVRYSSRNILNGLERAA